MSAEFWRMGGYGVYVWSCFGATLLAFGWNVLAIHARRRRLLKDIRERSEPPYGANP